MKKHAPRGTVDRYFTQTSSVSWVTWGSWPGLRPSRGPPSPSLPLGSCSMFVTFVRAKCLTSLWKWDIWRVETRMWNSYGALAWGGNATSALSPRKVLLPSRSSFFSFLSPSPCVPCVAMSSLSSPLRFVWYQCYAHKCNSLDSQAALLCRTTASAVKEVYLVMKNLCRLLPSVASLKQTDYG
jgi:hypothetical protein